MINYQLCGHQCEPRPKRAPSSRAVNARIASEVAVPWLHSLMNALYKFALVFLDMWRLFAKLKTEPSTKAE